MKGIILAGGAGTRLAPVTIAVSKQLLPVYDKPMIYYPLSVLLYAGIRDILIITRPDEQELFRRLLRDGRQWGVSFSYAVQPQPRGLPEAFAIGRDFIAGQRCALALGDNVLYGHGIQDALKIAAAQATGATIFSHPTKTPERYGVVVADSAGRPLELIEKPAGRRSNAAIIGLYFFDEAVADIAAGLAPSARGETEITDVLRHYLKRNALEVVPLGRGYAWFDSGTDELLMQASAFVQSIEERQGFKIGSPDEIAYRMGFITADDLAARARELANSSDGEYLAAIAAAAR